MVKRFLITTAMEDTWCGNKPVLFLGEWCKRYSRKEHWSSMDAEVLPYHWDDRVKLFSDYQYLQEFYERLLFDLSDQLNRMHGTNYGVRYWRILVGRWLGYFLQILFDRWTTIHEALAKYNLEGSIVFIDSENQLIPNDMTHFINLFVSDEWNHYIYSVILQRYTNISCEKKVYSYPEKQ
ncbi:MAG: hypothetical protein IPJ69_04580 [Deltaproteobacteria bacterium]|nr:MAG: hypothetical protein IPJ69_04580 [Deltaproteobacteria bacterium]